MAVRLPRLLDASLNERARLHPVAGTLNLVSPGVPEATQNLPPEDVQPAIHDWEEIYNQNGSVGFYRVTGRTLSYTGETALTLRHGIDTLSDSVYDAQQEYDGPVAGLLAAILDKQTTRIKGVKPWQLGTCADNTSIKRSLNYDNLKDLFNSIEEEKNNYYFAYDMTTWPWTVSFLAKPTAVAAEFRLHRNIQDIQVSMNDSELCTRLYLAVNVTTTTTPTADEQNEWPEVTTVDSVVRRYDNTEAQETWGIVVKTASIDTDDDIQGQGFPSANAWAARYMQDHAEPTLQIQISGQELKQLTGDGFDEAKLGSICRVTLPDYDAVFSQRIVAVSYPDLYGSPEQVNVSLANKSPKVSTSISRQKQEAAKAASTAQTALRKAGGGGGGGGAAKELESWAMICKKVKEAEDATGLTELSESGIVVDAETGLTLYSLTQGFTSQYAELKVQSGKISTLVQTTNGLSSRITQTADQIQAEVTARQNGEEVLGSRITQTAEMIQTEVTNRQNADNQMASRITQTADAITAEVTRASAAEGNLSSRITVNAEGIETKVSKNGVISAINQTAESITIQASKINLSGYTTASQFQAEQARLTNVITGAQRVTYLDCLQLQSSQSRLENVTVERGLTYAGYGDLAGRIIASFGAAVESSGVLTIPSTTLNGDSGPSFSFNITDTATYKAAAVSRVSVSLSGTPGEDSGHYYQSASVTMTKQNGSTQTMSSTTQVDSAVNYGRGLMGVRVNGNVVQRYESSLASVTITTDASVHYNATTHKYTALSLAYANGVAMTGTEDTSAPSGTEAYTAGQESVTVSSIAKNGTTTYSENYKTVYIPVTATASNGNSFSGTVSSDITTSYNAGKTEGQNGVTINKSAWANGVCTFTKSAGTASTKTVSLAQDETTTWRTGNYANIADVKVLDGSAETGLTISINAVSRYNAGYNECLGNMDSINISSNGSYYPSSYNCTGFSYVYVNVPQPSYTSMGYHDWYYNDGDGYVYSGEYRAYKKN